MNCIDMLGTYRLGPRLGEGGMGEVRLAVDTMLEREVAIKTLRPEMGERADLVERFRVEAIALARLHHRHIAAVHAFFEHGGQHHLVMQYVRGRTLETVLQERGRLPWREAVRVALDVSSALEHAHALGVVHRDLKPANLMLDEDGRTVVMDFGIARVLARGRQTRAGTLVGTLEYLAPEVIRGELADERSDLYALGCVLYELLSGALPFDARTDFELMRAHLEATPPPLGRRVDGLPPALEALLMRMLDKHPARRFPTATALAKALRSVVGPDSAWLPAAPAGPAAAGVRPSGTEPASAPADATTGLARRMIDAWRRAWAAVREQLAWPAAGGWPAWQRWAADNPGLTAAGAVGVVGSTALLVASLWPAPRPVAPTPAPAAVVSLAPAPISPVPPAVPASAPAAAPAFVAPTPVVAPSVAEGPSGAMPAASAPVYVMPPPPTAVVSIAPPAEGPAAGGPGTAAPKRPPAVRPAEGKARPTPGPRADGSGGDASADAGPSAEDSGPPPGWYVKR